jgi:lipopolysaccharide transport system ATP-binding protein
MRTVVESNNISKVFRLGGISRLTLTEEIRTAWHVMRGKANPFHLAASENDRIKSAGNSDYVWGLKDVNFEVKQGEIFGIVGRNGAGKSTLLKILSRITAPTSGEIKIKGKVSSLLEVGTGFHGDLTGRENTFLNGAIFGMRKSEIQKKLDAIIEFSGTQRYIDTPVKRYSSGMYVRLAFAVAAHLDPDILIIDEVLAVGDTEFQNKCLGKMKDVSEHGRTVIFVSHNMAAVNDLCTRAIYLNNGKVAFEGTTDAVIREYTRDNLMSSVSEGRGTEDAHLRHGNGKVRFKKVTILNVDGNKMYEFTPHEKVIIQMEVIINEPIDVLFASFAFRSGKTRDFIAFNKNFEIPTLGKKVGEPFSFEIIINDLNLNPGVYETYFELGFNSTLMVYDVLDNVLPPMIINLPIGKENLLVPGYFSLDADIKL